MTFNQWIIQFRTWLANAAIRRILRLTGTVVMYEGLILQEEDIMMVPPEILE